MNKKIFIWSIMIICLQSYKMLSQQMSSEFKMMGVNFRVDENRLICENLEDEEKTLSIVESEKNKTRYGVITYKCILKKKEVLHYNLNIKKGKLDVSITEYYGNDGDGNLKGITINWALREQKSEQQ